MENGTPAFADSPAPTKEIKPKRSKLKPAAVIVSLVALAAASGAFAYAWITESKKAEDARAETVRAEEELSDKNNRVAELQAELEERKETTGEENINKDQYQAVFFKNDQVYFGKITKITESQITLTDIYYLRNEGTADVSLAKLGNELHGPEDAMYIERREVNFWENLKPDGEVSKAISEYLRTL